MTKLKEEYFLRCEIMALWSGKGLTLARMKVVQMKCFRALKHHLQFKKYSKQVLANKALKHRIDKMRSVFQAWLRDFKVAKVKRDKEKFDRAVKTELQSISAQYQKEIETLRAKCIDAERQQQINNRNKHIMQENLKKVFMRSVCALNFEAMNILDPHDQSMMQQAMEKQIDNAMFGMGNNPIQEVLNDIQNPTATRSEVSFNLSEAQHTDRDYHAEQRDLMNLGM
jgi:centrosomal protein POC5